MQYYQDLDEDIVADMEAEMLEWEEYVMFAIFLYRVRYNTNRLTESALHTFIITADEEKEYFGSVELVNQAIHSLRAMGLLGTINPAPNVCEGRRKDWCWTSELLDNEELCERIVLELEDCQPVIWLCED